MKASNDMNFGVNNSINTEAKQVGISHNMGSTKLKLPHTNLKGEAGFADIAYTKENPGGNPNHLLTEGKDQNELKPKENPGGKEATTQHEDNIIAFIIVSSVFAWYLFH